MIKLFNCPTCNEEMEEITAYFGQGYCNFLLEGKEVCTLHVCTSRDCKDVGIVRCIPCEIKEV